MKPLKDEKIHKVSEVITEVDEMKNLKEMLAIVRKEYGSKNAFMFKTDTPGVFRYITYNEYLDEIEALGTALLNAGLKGKRIAVISENRYEWTLGYLATVTGVGIVVPLDKSLPVPELKSSIARSEVEAVIYSHKYEEVMAELNENAENKVRYYISMDKENSDEKMFSLKALIEEGKQLIANGDRSFIDAEIDNETMSIMLFTSGTTAQSKIVMLSHKNIISNLKDIAGTFDVTSEDRFLSFLPLHHVFECTVGFLYPVYRGGLIAYCDGIRHIAENLKEYQISAMISVPLLFESMYKQLWKTIDKKGMTKKVKFGIKLSRLLLKFGIDVRRKIFKEILDNLGGRVRLFVAGAAAFDKDVEKGFNDFGIATFQGYGLTETSPVIAAEHPTVVKYGSIGMLFPQVQAKIFEPDKDGMGELIVKAPSVMLGYYQNEEATKEAIDEEGWFHTGDLAYFDKDDYLFITGRKKSVIVLKNGKNVFPEELEVLVNQLEGVKESFVYGKPDPNDPIDLTLNVKVVYDEKIMQEKFGLTSPGEIKEKLWKDIKSINKTMPTYKYIKGISVTTEELIKTTTLKIKRFEEIKRV
jgi:long-chain acyl-CoA synthetase